MAEFEGDLLVVPGRDEGDRAVADDEPPDELFERADLDLPGGDPVHVGKGSRAVPDGVLVEGAHADAPVDQRPVALQGLVENMLPAAAPRLDGEHLRMALGGGEIECGVDPVDTFEHGDRVGECRVLGADGDERLERFGQFDRQASTVLDVAFDGVETLGQRDGRRNRPQPVGVVGIGVEQREFHQAGCGLHLGTCDAAGAQRPGVKPGPLGTQLRDVMGMRRFCGVFRQISTPRVLNVQEHDASCV